MAKVTRKILRLRIIAKYITQENFAYASGIDESLVSKLIRGVRDPSPEVAEKCAALLELPREMLFQRDEKEERAAANG